MKIITQLQGTLTEGEVQELRGPLNCLHLEPAKGFFMQMQLGESGMFLRRGKDIVVIPREALLDLMLPHIPELKPAPSTGNPEPSTAAD